MLRRDLLEEVRGRGGKEVNGGGGGGATCWRLEEMRGRWQWPWGGGGAAGSPAHTSSPPHPVPCCCRLLESSSTQAPASSLTSWLQGVDGLGGVLQLRVVPGEAQYPMPMGHIPSSHMLSYRTHRAVVAAITGLPVDAVGPPTPSSSSPSSSSPPTGGGLASVLLPPAEAFFRFWLNRRGCKLREEEVLDAWYYRAPTCPQVRGYVVCD